MNRSDGDGMWFVLGIFLVSLVVLFYVFPILLLITARDVVGWGCPNALMSIPVALFFDGEGWLDHPFVLALHSVYWGRDNLTHLQRVIRAGCSFCIGILCVLSTMLRALFRRSGASN